MSVRLSLCRSFLCISVLFERPSRELISNKMFINILEIIASMHKICTFTKPTRACNVNNELSVNHSIILFLVTFRLLFNSIPISTKRNRFSFAFTFILKKKQFSCLFQDGENQFYHCQRNGCPYRGLPTTSDFPK